MTPSPEADQVDEFVLSVLLSALHGNLGSLHQVLKYTKRGYTLLQNLTTPRTADWTELVIPLVDDGPFKLEFEGIRGESYEGDIAIDDIEVSYSNRPEQPIRARYLGHLTGYQRPFLIQSIPSCLT